MSAFWLRPPPKHADILLERSLKVKNVGSIIISFILAASLLYIDTTFLSIEGFIRKKRWVGNFFISKDGKLRQFMCLTEYHTSIKACDILFLYECLYYLATLFLTQDLKVWLGSKGKMSEIPQVVQIPECKVWQLVLARHV